MCKGKNCPLGMLIVHRLTGPETRPVQRYRLMIRSRSVEMEGSPSGKLAWRSNHNENVNDTWLVCR